VSKKTQFHWDGRYNVKDMLNSGRTHIHRRI
jgi:hypothetical protein